MPKLTPVPIETMGDLPLVKTFAGAGFVELIRRLLFVFHVYIPVSELTTLAILAPASLNPVLAHLCFELSSVNIPDF
jgi:hypothetical protein